MVKIDLSKIEEQDAYELIGGPYDGSIVSFACGLNEHPPKSITIEGDPTRSRGTKSERYVFDMRHEYDEHGEPVSEEIAFFHSP